MVLHGGRVLRFVAGTGAIFVLTLAGGLALMSVGPALATDWEPVVITSGSMEPTIGPGDVVLARPVDRESLAPGAIVVFDDAQRNGLVTHRVSSVNDDGSLVTKGDANQSPDGQSLHPGEVLGAGRLVVPEIGTPVLWFREGRWIELAALATAALACLYATAIRDRRTVRPVVGHHDPSDGSSMTAATVHPARRERAPTSTMADRVRSVLSMMAWLYLTVFVCLAMWIGVTVAAFGWSPNLTMSESMTPSVRPGDVVLTSPVGTEPLGIGSVIVYEGENGKIIHRVTAIDGDAYRTRGDANADEDPLPVQPDQIVGAGRLLIPMVGLPVHWFRSGNTAGFAGWLAITVAALVLAPNPHRRKRTEP